MCFYIYVLKRDLGLRCASEGTSLGERLCSVSVSSVSDRVVCTQTTDHKRSQSCRVKGQSL